MSVRPGEVSFTHFGEFTNPPCISGEFTIIDRLLFLVNSPLSFLVNSPLLIGCCFCWIHHYCYGPIITKQDIDILLSARLTHPSQIDEFVNDIHAPTPQEYEDLNSLIRSYRGPGYKMLEMKDNMKKNRIKRSRLNRIKRVIKMLSKLSHLMDPSINFIVLDYEIDANYTNYHPSHTFKISNHPCITIAHDYVNGLLRPYIIHPTTIPTDSKFFDNLAMHLTLYGHDN